MGNLGKTFRNHHRWSLPVFYVTRGDIFAFHCIYFLGQIVSTFSKSAEMPHYVCVLFFTGIKQKQNHIIILVPHFTRLLGTVSQSLHCILSYIWMQTSQPKIFHKSRSWLFQPVMLVISLGVSLDLVLTSIRPKLQLQSKENVKRQSKMFS